MSGRDGKSLATCDSEWRCPRFWCAKSLSCQAMHGPSLDQGRAGRSKGLKLGGCRDWTHPSRSVLSCPFWGALLIVVLSDFPDFSGIFLICPFSHQTTFPEKKGKRPGLGNAPVHQRFGKRSIRGSEKGLVELATNRAASHKGGGGIGRRVQKRGLNLWRRKDLLAPTLCLPTNPLWKHQSLPSLCLESLERSGHRGCCCFRSAKAAAKRPRTWAKAAWPTLQAIKFTKVPLSAWKPR